MSAHLSVETKNMQYKKQMTSLNYSNRRSTSSINYQGKYDARWKKPLQQDK